MSIIGFALTMTAAYSCKTLKIEKSSTSIPPVVTNTFTGYVSDYNSYTDPNTLQVTGWCVWRDPTASIPTSLRVGQILGVFHAVIGTLYVLYTFTLLFVKYPRWALFGGAGVAILLGLVAAVIVGAIFASPSCRVPDPLVSCVPGEGGIVGIIGIVVWMTTCIPFFFLKERGADVTPSAPVSGSTMGGNVETPGMNEAETIIEITENPDGTKTRTKTVKTFDAEGKMVIEKTVDVSAEF